MHKTKLCLLIGLLALGGNAKAGNFFSDFNDATVPPGATVNGSTVVEATGGVENSGVLKITKAVNSQSGSFVLSDLDGGALVYGFELTANVRIAGSSPPADGFSINFDPNAFPESTTGEEGTSGGLTFAFDIFDNGNENPPAPSIDFKAGGQVVATRRLSVSEFETGAGFAELYIKVGADGGVSLAWKGTTIFTNVYFPQYLPLSGASFVIGGRTGGLNANQFIDNLRITTFTEPKVGFVRQPVSSPVVAGSTVTLSAQVSNPEGATFQWFRNGTEVPGANESSLTLPSIGANEDGARYSLRVTGPNNTITSTEAVLTVREVPGPTNPQIAYTFDDGFAPPGSFTFANDGFLAGYISFNGGVNDSGVLHLVDAYNDARGGLIIEDFNGGAPVYGFTAAFDVRVGGGSEVPADGFSFNLGNNIEDLPAGELENGTGSGISIGFDIFDNGGGEAPSVDVRLGGALIASTKVPLSLLRTGNDYAPVLIRLENDGTLDVAYRGVLLHDNLALPSFSSISGGRVALGARTGGLNENIWVDNLRIETVLTSGDVRITNPPQPQTVLLGQPATFTVAVNDSNNVLFQWFRNGTAISGATSSTLTLPAVTAEDQGALFKVEVKRGNVTVTSEEVALGVLDLSRPASPTVLYDFNNGQAPEGTTVVGNDPFIAGYVAPSGGVNDSGVLHLIDAVNGASGAFVMPPLHGGAELESIVVAADILVGGGSNPPADGFSFNFAPDLPNTTLGEAENGTGSGLTIAFDIFDNGGENPPAPSVDVRWKGQVVASRQIPFAELRTEGFEPLLIRLKANGTVDVAFRNRVIFKDVQIPNYAHIANGEFGFYGRTGGLNENVWLDNVAILGTKTTAPLRITRDLTSVKLLPGNTTTFSVEVSDPVGVSYKWFRNGVEISGATGASYTPPLFTVEESGARFQVVATGPGGVATSQEAVVTVVPPITVTNPDLSLDFNQGFLPEGVTMNGTAYFGPEGALHLTDALNSQGGSLVISDLDAGAPINSFTAKFKVLVGGGSNPPADGFSFVWVNDLAPTTVFGEDGSGSGLIVSFDIFDNGNETPPAPSIDVRYNGALVGTAKMSFAEMRTGAVFEDVVIRVQSDGTLDLHYKNQVIFDNLLIPGFTAASNASFGIGARTGGLNENQWVDDLQIVTGFSMPTEVRITSISRDGANVRIEWTGGGTLQAAPSVLGNWSDLPGSSPATVPATGEMQFFRVKRN